MGMMVKSWIPWSKKDPRLPSLIRYVFRRRVCKYKCFSLGLSIATEEQQVYYLASCESSSDPYLDSIRRSSLCRKQWLVVTWSILDACFQMARVQQNAMYVENGYLSWLRETRLL